MTCIVVLGPPRSGTSAVAGVLHNLHVIMHQEEVTGHDAKNEKGYFEDAALNRYHHRMMGGNLLEPELQFVQADMAGYKALIESRMEQSLWGVKDPRLCYTFPALYRYVGHDMKLILTERKHDSITRSMMNFRGLGYESAGAVVDNYLRARWSSLAEARFSGLRLWVNYDTLLNDMEAQVKRLAAFTGGSVNAQALAFIDRNLRRY